MIGFIIGIIASCVYIYPVFSGLILLPLDLLVTNSAPWFLASQILIKNSYMLDSIIQMFPWRHMTFASLTTGIIPLWNPYQFTGLPFMAGMKPMVFYPFNLLFVFGEIHAWNLLLFFQLFLAFYFTYILARSFKVSVTGSILSAIAFAYSSLMVGFLQFGSDGHALIWLPLMLFFAKSFIDTKRIRYLFGLSFSITFAIFAGHLQFFGYQCITLAVFSIWYVRYVKDQFRSIIFVGLTSLLGIGMSAIQLLPSVEMFLHSYRGIADTSNMFSAGLMRPEYLFRLVSPDFFGSPITKDLHIGYIETCGYFGIVPLFFVLFSLFSVRSNPVVRFFALFSAVALTFSFSGPAKLLYYLHIPLITNGTGGRVFSLVLFGSAMLAGIGLDNFLHSAQSKDKMKNYFVFCISVFAILLGGFILNKYIFFGATFTNLKFSFIITGLFTSLGIMYVMIGNRVPKTALLMGVMFCGLAYFDLFRMGYRFLTFSNTKFLYPDIPVVQYVRGQTEKTLSRVYGLTGSEIPSVLKVYAVETYNPLYPMRMGILLKALEGKNSTDIPSNVFMFSYSDELKYLLDVVGVKYIATENDQNPAITYFMSPKYQEDLNKVYEDERHDVYENKTAYPRFTLLYDVKSGLSEDEILDDIRNRKTDLRKTLLLETLLNQEFTIGSGSAELISSDLNNQSYLVNTDRPGMLYITDAFFPGWTVHINGKPSTIHRANYNFRSVLVPAGTSEVNFRYDPVSFRVGKYLSGGSALALVLFGALYFIFRHNRKQTEHSDRSDSKNKKFHAPVK